MFQHLDERARPVDLDRLRSGVQRRAKVLHRRRRLMATTAFTILLLPVVAGYAVWRSVQPTRVHVFDDAPTSQPSTAITGASAPPTGPTTAATEVDAGDPVTVLVVGTDRGVVTEGQSVVSTDTILVVRLDPTGSRRVLAIPRDLKVTDERTGKEVRINSLLADRPALVRAVAAVSGTTIDHYVEIDTGTFGAVVDAIGGVSLSFTTPVRDLKSGFSADAGCQQLDGSQLRAYVRSRYIETLVDGTWQPDPTSEPGRVVRLADLAQRLAPRILDGAGIGPTDLLKTILPQLTVDDRLSLSEARHLVGVARQLRGTPLEWAVLPTRRVRVDNAEMLELIDGDAAGAFLARGTPTGPTQSLPAGITPVVPDTESCPP